MGWNGLFWAISSVLLLVYFKQMVVAVPFATVRRHFGWVLLLHVVLSVLAVLLRAYVESAAGRGVLPRVNTQAIAAWQALFELFIKAYVAVLVMATVSFVAAFVRVMVARVAAFHLTHNAQNQHRQPVRFVLHHQQTIVKVYQTLFMLGGVYMLWAVWFKITL